MPKTNQDTDMKVIRRLGSNEAYQLGMCQLGQYRGTSVSCRFVVPPHLVPIESFHRLKSAFKVAVADIVMRHPMTQVGMVNATSNTPSWVQLQSLDLTEHIKWIHVGDQDDYEHTLHETFCAQLDERFPDSDTKPACWKFTILRQENAAIMDVLLTFHHSHFDGAAAKVLQEDLLEKLNTNQEPYKRPTLVGDILKLPESQPSLPAPIEKLVKLPLDLTYIARTIWEETRPQLLTRDSTLATWSPIRSSPYKTQYRAFFMEPPCLRAILDACRQHETTMTALLHGMALISFAKHLGRASAPGFQSSTIMDHRRNLPPPPADALWGSNDRAVSNYVTQMPHRFETDLVARIRSKLGGSGGGGDVLSGELLDELWAVSGRIRREITTKLKDGLRNDQIGVIKYITDWQQTMSQAAKKTRQFSWLVTNLGVVDGHGTPQRDGSDDSHGQGSRSWSIDRAQFGLSAEIPAAAIEFSPVSIAGGRLCVGASWPDCALDVELGEGFMADMERWLGQIVVANGS